MDPQAAQTEQSSRVKKPLIFLIIILAVVVLGTAALLVFKGEPTPSGPTVLTGQERDLVTIGFPVTVPAVFPESDPDFYSVVFNNNIFEGLGRIVNGEVKPALAVSWSNPDNNTWRFKLRENVKFHNGDNFKASDVKFSIDQAIKNEWPNSFNLSTVDSVKVVDDSTVDIKTTSPDPVLLNRLVFAFVVSEKQFKTRGKKPPVGTGPYKFVSLDKEKGVLEVNKNYYLGASKVKKAVYKFFADDATDQEKLESLRKGEVDIVSIEDSVIASSAKTDFQVKTLADPFISFLWLDADRDKSPYVGKTPNPLKNKDVRQAIYKVIDVSKVAKAAKISAIPASQFVTEAIFGFNPNIKRPTPSVENAKGLMKKAGFAQGFTLTIDIFKGREKEAEEIAKQLEKINIKTKVNTVPGDKFVDKLLINRDTSAFIIDYGAETFDAGEIFVNVLHTAEGSFGSDNLTNYSNSDIDKLAEELTSIFKTKTRQDKLQEAMSKAVEELPNIPLYNKEFSYIVRNSVDWTPKAFGAVYASEVSGREVTN